MAENRVTGVGSEVLHSGATPNAIVSGVGAQVLNSGANSNARVTGVAVQVLSAVAVTGSGTQDFNSAGSDAFVVPAYGTLTVERWGGGGAGIGNDIVAGALAMIQGADGGTTSDSLGGSVTGGAAGNISTGLGGTGGTASGGNTTNTNGNAGGDNGSVTQGTLGHGAGAPNGGGDVAAPPDQLGNVAGNQGSAPGGGGSGCMSHSTGGVPAWYAGGGSGAYSKSVYHAGDPGAPVAGSSISFTVGAGGPAATSAVGMQGGDGSNGRMRVTWTAPLTASTCHTSMHVMT